MKKFLSIVLTLAIMLTVLPFGLFTIPTAAATSGKTGDCTWTLDDNGVLTISGTGEIDGTDFSELPFVESITTVIVEKRATSVTGFHYWTSLKKVIISDGVTTIGDHAFHSCTNIEEVIIPDSVTYIGNGAFFECSSLISIKIPAGVTYLGGETFYECNSLDSVHITDLTAWLNIDFEYDYANPLLFAEKLYLNNTLVTDFVVPDDVTKIKRFAFTGCSGFDSITIGKNVTNIEECAFYKCNNIESIIIPDSVTSIGDSAIVMCENLKSITLSKGVKSIGRGAVYIYGNKVLDAVYYLGSESDRKNMYIASDNNVLNNSKWYYNSCIGTVEHSYDEHLDIDCNVCGAIRVIIHNYSNACDSICNDCDFIREVPDHVYSEIVTDSTCTEMGYITFVCVHCGYSYIGDEIPLMGHSYEEVEVDPICTEMGYIGEVCSNCGDTIIYEEIPSTGHDYYSYFVNPTCTQKGYLKHYCMNCGDTYKTDEVAALGHKYSNWIVTQNATTDKTGSQYKECACGDKITMTIPRKIKFAGASLTLESNIAINYKVKSEYFDIDKYEEIYLVVSFNGEEYIVRDPEYNAREDRWVFSFKEVSGDLMTGEATATVYGVYQSEVFKGNSAIYSAVAYAKNMLPKDNTPAIVKKLIVDLVNYGAAAQIYTNHNTDDLANAWLTEAQKALATQELRETTTHQNLKYEVIDNPTVSWKGAGLKLESAITVRYTIQASDLTNLKAVLQINGETFEVPSSEFVLVEDYTDRYYIYFDKPTASQMSMPILATIYKGDTAVSNTVQYSIESYINTNKNTSNTKLADLLKAMLKYGDSAYNYAYN